MPQILNVMCQKVFTVDMLKMNQTEQKVLAILNE